MEESPVGKWFPFWIDWFNRASESWDDAWWAPIIRLLKAMWPAGGALDDRDELLARTARVPLKTWCRIREETGFFWVVKDGKFVQPFLQEKYEEAMAQAWKRSEKASKGGKAKQTKARERLVKDLAAQAASSSARSTAPSTSSSTPVALLEPPIRAYEVSSSDQEEREDQYASAVPKPEFIEACFQAYPRTRGKGAANRAVAIPENARELIAVFLLERPAYPLLDVFRAIATSCDFPPGMADFLAAPWDAESTLRSAQTPGKAKPAGKPAWQVEAETRAARESAEWNDLTEAEQQAKLREFREQAEKVKQGRFG